MADTYEFFANRSKETDTPGFEHTFQIERETRSTSKQPMNTLSNNAASISISASIQKQPNPSNMRTFSGCYSNTTEELSSTICTPIQSKSTNLDKTVDLGSHTRCLTPTLTIPITSNLGRSKFISEGISTSSVSNNVRRAVDSLSNPKTQNGPGAEGEASSGDSLHSHLPSKQGSKRQHGRRVPFFRPPLK
ncbi:hypothetical protein K7432_017445 [Basidiobolus ranarum]|uniref:Uncharacterized protein n=1 Tax=Basidiobolus ranarum TaxID=34480 RepID=A0ABR2WDC5_9FUNG